MSETGKPWIGAGPRTADARTLQDVIDHALERRANMSITLADSTVGVSLDTRGDWTVSIGLSLKSDRFHSISSGLERLGFFHATENEGTRYFLWTSILTETDNARTATEQVLGQAVKILQTTPVSQYIS